MKKMIFIIFTILTSFSYIVCAQTMIYKYHTFHNVATVAADGTDCDVAGLNSLTVQIRGSVAGNSAINFLGSLDRTNFLPITGMDLGTISPATSTAEKNKLFIFDIRGIQLMRMDLVSLTDGNVTVKGFALK